MKTQNGFRKGRSRTDPKFFLKLLIEKRTEYNLEKTLFIDYEREFDSVKKDRFYLVF